MVDDVDTSRSRSRFRAICNCRSRLPRQYNEDCAEAAMVLRAYYQLQTATLCRWPVYTQCLRTRLHGTHCHQTETGGGALDVPPAA